MILNVYKPKNWTSFDVVAKVRGMLNSKAKVLDKEIQLKTRGKVKRKKIKVGHAGTLDPLAEGVLIVLTSEDTKKQDLIMKKPKEYVAEIAFGAKSPTYDLEGDLTYSDEIPTIEEVRENIEKLLPNYLGEIQQKVPGFSAAKINGKRLYEKAREGNLSEDEIPTKNVVIHSFDIGDIYIEKVGEKDLPVLKCTVVCGSGTYLRSIAHDLGADMYCGGVLVSLVRTRVGDYKIDSSLTIEEIEKKLDLNIPTY